MLKLSVKTPALLLTLLLLSVVPGYAATTVRASVFPATTVAGGTVTIHTGLVNNAASSKAVTAIVTIKNPGSCVTNNLPSSAGAIALGLRPWETRLATLSLTIPPRACAGTYTVVVTVKNSAGTVIASHTTTFTIRPFPPS
jgi:hypothetical protein